MRRLSCSVSGIFFIFLCAPSFLRLRYVAESANVTTLKIGLYANAFLSNGSSDDNGAQSLAGFLMAIREINSIPSILPNIRLAVALRSGRGVYGAITAAQAFTTANFSIDSQGKRVPDSTFIRNNPVGVDVLLGAGNDVETEQTNQVLNYFKIVQLHTVATSTDLGVGQDYPYKIQTTPIISYEAMVLQHMLCFYFNLEKIAIIATDDNNGLKSVVEIGDGNYCSLKSISVQSFALGVSDFTNIISTAKLSGARIFVLFMPSSSAAMFLEQAYDQGLLTEGTQVFGNSLTMEDPISSHFKNPSNTKNIMRGFIGIKYSPNFAVHATPVGRGFAHRFGQQVDTVGTASDGSTTCSNSTDDTNESLYQPQTAHGLSQSACSGLRFSRFRSNGSVSNSANGIYQFTPHAYDAVYALAQGIQRILAVHGRDDINGDLLHSTFINDIYFYGATGLVKFYGGMSNYLYYAMGDREVGHTYLMYNFNDEVYDASNRTNGLAVVASWSLETGGVTLCSEDPELVMGGNCVSGFTYRTVDNSPCTDMPPDIYVELSVHMGRAMTALGSVVVIVVAIFFILIFKYRRSRLIKASQPSMIYIIHLGCLFGGMRTIVGGMSVDDASCTAAFWTGHLAFGLTFSALLVKTWRVHRVVNNKSLKRVKITGNTITGITCTVISCLCFYLIITTVVGKPHLSYLSSEVSNQITRNAICSFTYPEFSTALYAIEALSLMYGARLCYATKNAPDAINEAYFIASAVFVIGVICMIVFPVIFIIKTSSDAINQLIASITFSAVTTFVMFIIFYPKLSVLLPGGDIDVVAGFKKKTEYFARSHIDRISEESRRRKAERNSNSTRVEALSSGGRAGGMGTRSEASDQNCALSAPKTLIGGDYSHHAANCLNQIQKWEQMMVMIEARFSAMELPASGESSGDLPGLLLQVSTSYHSVKIAPKKSSPDFSDFK